MPILSRDRDRPTALGPGERFTVLDGRSTVLIRESKVLLDGGRAADALLVQASRIRAVGEPARALAAAEPPGQVHELALPGLTIAAGFIDAHTHVVHMGMGLARPNLAGAPSAAAAIERVRMVLADHPPERPLIAEQWDDSGWAPGDRLQRADLDRLASSTPIVMRSVCCHRAVANGAALAGLARHPDAARYAARGLVDATSGTLIEDAAMRLGEVFPPGEDEVSAALDAALAHAARLGVTGVHDIVTSRAMRVQQTYRRNGRLTLRITAHVAIEHLDALERLGLISGLGDEWFKLGGVKLFLDGSLGACTASLTQPYADRPGEQGLLLIDPEQLHLRLRQIDSLGLQALIHAIGDRAIAAALDALEPLGPEAVRERRHRLEHCEQTPDELVERLARIGATASMQPNFVTQWGMPGGMYGIRLGSLRVREMNRFRSLDECGVPIAFGSDCMPMGPLAGMNGAVNHPLETERLTASQALAAYTLGSARAGFAEAETGSIEAGKLADFVILEGDPISARDPGADCRVVGTIVGGKCVYEAEPAATRGA
jgi:predicted amidohydrolase YtcJ